VSPERLCETRRGLGADIRPTLNSRLRSIGADGGALGVDPTIGEPASRLADAYLRMGGESLLHVRALSARQCAGIRRADRLG